METLVQVLFQNPDTFEVEVVWETTDVQAADDYADMMNDKLAERGLPGCYATTEGR